MSEKKKWEGPLAKIRDELLTAAFTQAHEAPVWMREGFGSETDWYNSLGDLAHGLFVPLRALEADNAALKAALEKSECTHRWYWFHATWHPARGLSEKQMAKWCMDCGTLCHGQSVIVPEAIKLARLQASPPAAGTKAGEQDATVS